VQTREGHGGLGLHAANFEDSGVGCLLRRVPQECALADPGRTGQHQRPGPAAPGALEQVVDELAFGVAAVQHGPTLSRPTLGRIERPNEGVGNRQFDRCAAWLPLGTVSRGS
jgi:hypothetical protein